MKKRWCFSVTVAAMLIPARWTSAAEREGLPMGHVRRVRGGHVPHVGGYPGDDGDEGV